MVSQTGFRLLYLASLIESYAIYHAAAVSGWYFAHPESKYFGIPTIAKDQLEDYAQLKDMEESRGRDENPVPRMVHP